MKICVECRSGHADDLSRCPQCGGELRRRTVYEALEQIVDEAEKAKNACPRCGQSIQLDGHFGVCPNCGAEVVLVAGNDGRSVLIRS